MQELARRGHICVFAPGSGNWTIDPVDWDVVVAGNVTIVPNSIAMLRSNGIKIVYDVDDAIELIEPHNLSYAETKRHAPSHFDMRRAVDLVTTSTVELAQRLRVQVPASVPVIVLPNCVREGDWRKRLGKNTVPKIGFAGSVSHLRDLVPVLQAVHELEIGGFGGKFDFAIFGISDVHDSLATFCEKYINAPSPELREVVAILHELSTKIRYAWHRSVSLDKHQEHMAALNLDLGLCPLEPTEFNRFKSCLKAYEYAMVGTEVMCSAVAPYVSQLPGTIFQMVEHNPKAWSDALGAWISEYSESRSSAAAQAQRDWVVENKAIETNAELWETAFSRLLRKDS